LGQSHADAGAEAIPLGSAQRPGTNEGVTDSTIVCGVSGNENVSFVLHDMFTWSKNGDVT